MVAPQVAKLLGFPLLDRAISFMWPPSCTSRSRRLKAVSRRSLPDRFISALVPLAAGVIATTTDTLPRDLSAPPGDGALFREQADAIMRAALVSGAVILGAQARQRSATSRACCGSGCSGRRGTYRPGGPDREHRRGDRVAAAAPGGPGPPHYVRRRYRADIDDPVLFPLHIDSTALPLDAVAELIVSAYRATSPDSQTAAG